MEVDPWFWAYAALHRLGTMIAGVVFVSLGFPLFRQKVRAATDLNLSLGDRQLNLSTTAPGTYFALLGAGVICTMLFQGNPTYEGIGPDGKTFRVTKGPALTEPAAGPVNRGETHSGFLAAYQRGLEQRKEGDDEAALEALSEALAIKDATLEQAAGPLREVAEIYLEQGRSAEALPLARIATGLDDDNPASLNTLAQVLLARNQVEEALEAVKQGLELSGNNAELLRTQALIGEAKGGRSARDRDHGAGSETE